jgi:hypothetical protein
MARGSQDPVSPNFTFHGEAIICCWSEMQSLVYTYGNTYAWEDPALGPLSGTIVVQDRPAPVPVPVPVPWPPNLQWARDSRVPWLTSHTNHTASLVPHQNLFHAVIVQKFPSPSIHSTSRFSAPPPVDRWAGACLPTYLLPLVARCSLFL